MVPKATGGKEVVKEKDTLEIEAMRFAVFGHVEHKREGKNIYAYAPYVREMNIWFSFVKEVEVVAPETSAKVGAGESQYKCENLYFTPIPSFSLTSLRSIMQALFKIPIVSYKIYRTMRRADHLHLRCPGNIGLLACFIQILFPRKPKTAKYAGNWNPAAKQPWSYRLQKWLLDNSFLTRNMQVLVYGNWPGQSKNIKPFFTASFSEAKSEKVVPKDFEEPYRFLFVGSLVPGKRPFSSIYLVEKLLRKEIPVTLDIYGDGPLRAELEVYSRKNKLREVFFHGSRPLEELKDAYEEAHFCVLASKSEGWPKAIAEAMFFGVIPIATAISCVPWMLDEGGRGILIRDNSEDKILDAMEEKVVELIKDPAQMRQLSETAQHWSQQYTLEKFQEGIRTVLGNVSSIKEGEDTRAGDSISFTFFPTEEDNIPQDEKSKQL